MNSALPVTTQARAKTFQKSITFRAARSSSSIMNMSELKTAGIESLVADAIRLERLFWSKQRKGLPNKGELCKLLDQHNAKLQKKYKALDGIHPSELTRARRSLTLAIRKERRALYKPARTSSKVWDFTPRSKDSHQERGEKARRMRLRCGWSASWDTEPSFESVGHFKSKHAGVRSNNYA